jgi:hypothetical protein
MSGDKFFARILYMLLEELLAEMLRSVLGLVLPARPGKTRGPSTLSISLNNHDGARALLNA